jgi:hypothetical protein
MKRFSLFAIIIAMGLAGCTAADWDNAMSFLPAEKGMQAQAPVEAPSASDQAPSTAVYSSAAPSLSSMPVPADSAARGVEREVAIQHCRAVATQRSSDGAYMGMDEGAQEQEYNFTYANCMAWKTAHSD